MEMCVFIADVLRIGFLIPLGALRVTASASGCKMDTQ